MVPGAGAVSTLLVFAIVVGLKVCVRQGNLGKRAHRARESEPIMSHGISVITIGHNCKRERKKILNVDDQSKFTMHLMFTLDDAGNRVYTLKVSHTYSLVLQQKM